MTEVTEKAQGGGWPTWVRDSAFLVAIAGSAWVVADAIGDLKAGLARNAALIERNAEGIARNAAGIGEVKESVAKLTGQYEEHTREHQRLAGR